MAPHLLRSQASPYVARGLNIHMKPQRLRDVHFRKFLDALSSTATMALVTAVGAYFGDWLVENLYKIAYQWFYVIFPLVIFSLSASVLRWARPHVRLFQYGLLLSVSWILSLIIGTLGHSFMVLLVSLLPFYQNLWV